VAAAAVVAVAVHIAAAAYVCRALAAACFCPAAAGIAVDNIVAVAACAAVPAIHPAAAADSYALVPGF